MSQVRYRLELQQQEGSHLETCCRLFHCHYQLRLAKQIFSIINCGRDVLAGREMYIWNFSGVSGVAQAVLQAHWELSEQSGV